MIDGRIMAGKSSGGPPQSKTLVRILAAHEPREAFWSAPALGVLGRACEARQFRKPVQLEAAGQTRCVARFGWRGNWHGIF